MSRAALARPVTSEAQLASMRAAVRAECADRPGVYRMLSADGEVVYVGKSKRVRTRLLGYFRAAFPEEKGARIVRDAQRIEWEYTPSEFAALLLELRLIKRLRPRFNVAMKRDARNLVFVKVTRGPAARLLVVRGASEEAAAYYGPFQGAQRVGEALRELNDVLGLRDCSLDRKRMHFAGQAELFPVAPRTPGCIRYEVRKCLGPCIGACTERRYAERVAQARAFLDGADDAVTDRLRGEMERASDDLAFERAAALRDKLHRLEDLKEQFLRFRFAVETLSFVYPVVGEGGDDRLYFIRRGRVRGEIPAPATPTEHARCRRMIDEIFGPVERDSAQVPTHEIDELLLLSSWFRRFPAELDRTQRAGDPGLRSLVGAAAGEFPAARIA